VQQESQFFRALFDEAPLPYQSLDSEGRLLTVNRAWQDELGYEKHEVLGWWFGDFVCADQKPLFRERFRQFVEEGRVQGVVWQLLRKDGSSLHVSFSGRITRDENGRFLRSQCMFFDLSKRSEAEEQLRQSEELRMAFMESAEEGFALFDSQLRMIYTNQAGARMLGTTPEELIGRTIDEISPDTEQTDRFTEYQRVLETGESFSIDAFISPTQSEERRFAMRAFKVGDNLGVVLRDVTEAKLSEQQLHESEARWRAMAEGSPDHVMLLDRDLVIEYANYASLGLTVDQLIGTPLIEYVDQQQRESVRQTLQTVLDSGDPVIYETEYFDPEGGKLSYESHAVSRVVNGEVVGLIVSARDITRQQVDAERIEGLLKRQTAMAALAMEFGRASNLLDVYRTTCGHVSDLMNVDSLIVSRYALAEQMIRASYSFADGEEQDVHGLPPLPLEAPGKGMQSQVIRSGKPLIVDDFHRAMANTQAHYRIARPDKAEHEIENEGSRLPNSALIVPMKVGDDVIGVIQVQSHQLDAYQSEDAELLSGLASIMAVTIENRELARNSQLSYEGIIRVLAKAIELRDPYTSQHQLGVALIATRIAQLLDLPAEQIRAIELAANIHDIGKIIIPVEILSKPSHLSGAQLSIVQSHVAAAHEVLEDIAFPWPIDEIVVQHHERLDGSGYPRGIEGEDIRLEARILAVADIVDAMTSHRPYRPAFSLEETMAELRRLRHSALDPTVVDACLIVLERDTVSPTGSA